MDKGFFGLFDFNNDGFLDSFERAAGLTTFMEFTNSEEDESDSEDD